jgi:hypothetical protein
MSARAGAAQELGSGLLLGRLIPLEGSRGLPGATGSASEVVSVGSGRAITFVDAVDRLQCEQPPVGAGELSQLAVDRDDLLAADADHLEVRVDDAPDMLVERQRLQPAAPIRRQQRPERVVESKPSSSAGSPHKAHFPPVARGTGWSS